MYQLTSFPNCIKRLSDGAFIPTDPENPDYAEFLLWEQAGNTPLPAPGPVTPQDPIAPST